MWEKESNLETQTQAKHDYKCHVTVKILKQVLNAFLNV